MAERKEKEEINLIETCYNKAIKVIKKCSTKYGLFASAGKKGYNAVWARDSMISLIGASLSNEQVIKETFKQSLITLASEQSEKGQIPNCVDKFSNRKPHVDFKSIDSSLWFIIGHYIYKKRYKNNSLLNQNKEAIKKALTWLSYQDIGEDNMLEQLPTTDWQDAFPHKYGHTINTQALYYKVLNLTGQIKKAAKLKKVVNENKDDKLWNNSFYLAYRWKNHNKYKEIGDWFDSLGNLLAIVFDIASRKQTEKIISHIQNKKINLPYPIKAIWPTITKNSKYWQDYYLDANAVPYNYLNAGIWPYIGSFYVLALIKLKKFKEAKKQLEKLAQANLKGKNKFPEWINPITKKPYGSLQAWDAGTYIFAYQSLKQKKILI